MKFYIPSIGEIITLSQPWTFTLHAEKCNFTLFEKLEGNYKIQYIRRDRRVTAELIPIELSDTQLPIYLWFETEQQFKIVKDREISLPSLTQLKIKRIYIRKRQSKFNSVTFKIMECPSLPQIIGSRFWAKLNEVNEMEINDDTIT